MAQKKAKTKLQIESIKHKDKRKNIPTEELRDFVAEDEAKPKTMLYPRDSSLDPQLVWKGKDEQDRVDLAVPVVPVYIQEKIHPQAIIDAMPRLEQPGDNQPSLFADFNGGPADFEQKVEFYQHDQNWTNRMILGDSLLVMTSLTEKEGLKGKVQAIYLDPPYGIKFGSNWQVSTRKRDITDGKAEDTVRQPEQIKAFRDTWERGIHSYLSYLRDRFIVARELLTETGSIFVQIGDENVHLVRSLMDEVFGSENVVAVIPFVKTSGKGGSGLDTVNDYLLWYAKDKDKLKYRQLYIERSQKSLDQGYTWIESPDGNRRRLTIAELRGDENIPVGRRFISAPLNSQSGGENARFEIDLDGKKFIPTVGYWKTNRSGMAALQTARRLIGIKNTLAYVRYEDDFPVVRITNWWGDTQESTFAADKFYVVQTYTKIIERCLLMTTDPGDLVLDPTCGSGTTAYVAEQWGRRWITIDTSRVALALARTRLMSAKYLFYLLSDSQEGIKKEAELTGKMPANYKTEGDIRKGFVYKRVPHVMLKSIVNNPDIKEGMTREQIDAAIARHADSETLYDQPYEDNRRVRVCGRIVSFQRLMKIWMVRSRKRKHAKIRISIP
jgi:adenine-specific DNA-methyltransferase